MQVRKVRSPGWDDPLEKEMTTHPVFLPWKNLMDRGTWQAALYGSQRVGHDLETACTQD